MNDHFSQCSPYLFYFPRFSWEHNEFLLFFMMDIPFSIMDFLKYCVFVHSKGVEMSPKYYPHPFDDHLCFGGHIMDHYQLDDHH